MGSYHYATDAASRMMAAMDDTERSTVTQMARALRIGCTALRRLKGDLGPTGQLRRDIERMAKLRGSAAEQVRQATSSVPVFLESFGRFEEGALRRAGVEERLIQLVFEDVEAVLEKVRKERPRADTVLEHISTLERVVCGEMHSLVFAMTSAEHRELVRRRVKRGINGIAGCGVIAINASTDAVTTLGLAPWMTQVSIGLGGALLERATSN